MTRLAPLRVLAIALALLAPARAFALGNGRLQIHHVDVGQGDGALLISPLGQTALFDDGTYLNCANIKSTLQGLGITTVDYHLVSHYHADHLGCIDDLAAVGITIGVAGYDRAYSYSSQSYTSYVNTLGAKRQTIVKGQVITLDAGSPMPVTVTCVDLNGAGVYSVNGSDENPKSIVYRIAYGNFREEIGGDLTGSTGSDVETVVGPEVGDVDVYKVHHHGSKYSTNDNWLNATTPQVAVVSVGDGNSYGHPTPEAMGRLHAHGVKVYWTEQGAGATPDPAWDEVAHGTVVVECCRQASAADTFTVSGPGFSDSYPIASSVVGVPGPPPYVASPARLDVDRTIVGPAGVRLTLSGIATGAVELRIVDARGALVRTLASGAPADPTRGFETTWDGTTANGARTASGVYRAVARTAHGILLSPALVVLR